MKYEKNTNTKSKYLINQKIKTRKINKIGGNLFSNEQIMNLLLNNPSLLTPLTLLLPTEIKALGGDKIISSLLKNPKLLNELKPFINNILNGEEPTKNIDINAIINSLKDNLISQNSTDNTIQQLIPPTTLYPPTPNPTLSTSIEPIKTMPISNITEFTIENKPTSKDIISLLKVVFHESWFQDQFLDILSKNLKTQYFNKILEVTLFNIFNNILDNINKNDNIIITISLLKNNTKYFEELIKLSIDNPDFYDNERIYQSNDNVFRVNSKTSENYSRVMTKNFRNLLLPENNVKTAEEKNDEQSIEFKNIRAKYLLELEKEKIKLDEEEKQYKEQKKKDRKESYNKMISQNIQAQVATPLDENSIKQIMAFFNNIEGSIDSTDNNVDGAIINGEQFNEMIIRTIADCIKDMLQEKDSTKELIRIILNRFDYMLKEFIDIMQNNGIVKMILLRIFDKYPFIFVAFQNGIENAINKKIESISKKMAIGEAFITKEDIQNDYAFFKSVISSVIDVLTNKLELFIPGEENPNDTLTGGNKISQTKKKIQQYLIKHKKSNKTQKKTVGWFW